MPQSPKFRSKHYKEWEIYFPQCYPNTYLKLSEMANFFQITASEHATLAGVEAAIDLAGIVNHVTVLQRGEELKADKVLQERLRSLPNVTVLTNALTQEITGTDKVNGLTYVDSTTGEESHLELDGVFIQIGLLPNTEFLKGTIELNTNGEVIVNKHGATSMPGVFAAGDCSDTVYKQIVISMGSGATAALGAFDYLIRNTAPTKELVGI